VRDIRRRDVRSAIEEQIAKRRRKTELQRVYRERAKVEREALRQARRNRAA
jgi:hypothetical protein